MENTKFCQSCGMPLEDKSMYGKNGDGSLNEDYCQYCFPNGSFNNPNETLEQMIETCIPYLVEGGVCPNEEVARNMLQEQLPKLKRWRA